MSSGVKVRCYFEARTIGRALDPGERSALGRVAKGKARVTMDRLVVDGRMRALPGIDGSLLVTLGRFDEDGGLACMDDEPGKSLDPVLPVRGLFMSGGRDFPVPGVADGLP